MRCPYCDYDFGDGGMLPARCPSCNANMAPVSDKRDVLDGAHRRVAARVNDRMQIQEATRREGGTFSNSLIALIIVGLIIAALAFGSYYMELWGGRSIPDVVGWRYERAESELEAAGFKVRVDYKKDDGEAGFVLSQDPHGRRRVLSGSTISLSVSEARVMPEIVGLTRQEAEKLLSAEGLSYEFVEVASDDEAGIVLEASYESGKVLTSEQNVKVTITGPRVVPVVIGLTETEATRALEANELTVKVVYVEVKDDGAEGAVSAVEPAEGTVVEKGTEVTLSVNRARKQRLEELAEEIVYVVYNCENPLSAEMPIGVGLRPFVEPTLPVSYSTPASEVNDYSIWHGVVKHWQDVPAGAPETFAGLARNIMSVDKIEADVDSGVVVVTLTVHWDWSALGDYYYGAYSEDTRTVTLTFNDEDYLIYFDDPLTDIPAYQIVWTPAPTETDQTTETNTTEGQN